MKWGVIMTQFKALRQGKGLTQQNIADLLGITRGAYANIENGKREPDFAALFALADYFKVSIDYLLGRDDQKKEPTPVSEDGLSETARQFMSLVDRLSPAQQDLLLSQLQAWTEQNQRQALAAQQSGEEKAPESDP